MITQEASRLCGMRVGAASGVSVRERASEGCVVIGPLLMSYSCTASALQYAVGRSLAACLRNTGKDVHVLLQLYDKSVSV